MVQPRKREEVKEKLGLESYGDLEDYSDDGPDDPPVDQPVDKPGGYVHSGHHKKGETDQCQECWCSIAPMPGREFCTDCMAIDRRFWGDSFGQSFAVGCSRTKPKWVQYGRDDR